MRAPPFIETKQILGIKAKNPKTRSLKTKRRSAARRSRRSVKRRRRSTKSMAAVMTPMMTSTVVVAPNAAPEIIVVNRPDTAVVTDKSAGMTRPRAAMDRSVDMVRARATAEERRTAVAQRAMADNNKPTVTLMVQGGCQEASAASRNPAMVVNRKAAMVVKKEVMAARNTAAVMEGIIRRHVFGDFAVLPLHPLLDL